MKTNARICSQYHFALPNAGNATVRVEQKVNGVYQYLTTQQTQTTSGLYEIFLPMTACYAYRKSSLPFGSSPNQENIRISVSGTSGFALQQISLERDNVDTLVNTYLVSRGYRYGFNGMEKDDEVAGNGNNYTAEFWQYDSRLGRRWNIDPVVKHHESPYAAFANNPIYFIDPNGADTINFAKTISSAKYGTALNQLNKSQTFRENFQSFVDGKNNNIRLEFEIDNNVVNNGNNAEVHLQYNNTNIDIVAPPNKANLDDFRILVKLSPDIVDFSRVGSSNYWDALKSVVLGHELIIHAVEDASLINRNRNENGTINGPALSSEYQERLNNDFVHNQMYEGKNVLMNKMSSEIVKAQSNASSTYIHKITSQQDRMKLEKQFGSLNYSNEGAKFNNKQLYQFLFNMNMTPNPMSKSAGQKMDKK